MSEYTDEELAEARESWAADKRTLAWWTDPGALGEALVRERARVLRALRERDEAKVQVHNWTAHCHVLESETREREVERDGFREALLNEAIAHGDAVMSLTICEKECAELRAEILRNQQTLAAEIERTLDLQRRLDATVSALREALGAQRRGEWANTDAILSAAFIRENALAAAQPQADYDPLDPNVYAEGDWNGPHGPINGVLQADPPRCEVCGVALDLAHTLPGKARCYAHRFDAPQTVTRDDVAVHTESYQRGRADAEREIAEWLGSPGRLGHVAPLSRLCDAAFEVRHGLYRKSLETAEGEEQKGERDGLRGQQAAGEVLVEGERGAEYRLLAVDRGVGPEGVRTVSGERTSSDEDAQGDVQGGERGDPSGSHDRPPVSTAMLLQSEAPRSGDDAREHSQGRESYSDRGAHQSVQTRPRPHGGQSRAEGRRPHVSEMRGVQAREGATSGNDAGADRASEAARPCQGASPSRSSEVSPAAEGPAPAEPALPKGYAWDEAYGADRPSIVCCGYRAMVYRKGGVEHLSLSCEGMGVGMRSDVVRALLSLPAPDESARVRGLTEALRAERRWWETASHLGTYTLTADRITAALRRIDAALARKDGGT